MGASEKPPAPYGKYQNVFLTESEYAELKQEYPDCLERLIEEMSQYIASSGNDYVCHAAALRRWLDREKKGEPEKGNPRLFLQGGREPMTDTPNRSTATTARRRQDDESAESGKRSRTQADFYRLSRDMEKRSCRGA